MRINSIVFYTSKFEHEVKKVTDKKIREIFEKNIKRIIETPEIGKPLRYVLKGERKIRISPFKIIYAIKGSDQIPLFYCDLNIGEKFMIDLASAHKCNYLMLPT